MIGVGVIPCGHWRGGNRMARQPGLFDLDERYRKLSEVGGLRKASVANSTATILAEVVEIDGAVRGGAIVGHGAAAFCGCAAE
jgi:hypothetical protein